VIIYEGDFTLLSVSVNNIDGSQDVATLHLPSWRREVSKYEMIAVNASCFRQVEIMPLLFLSDDHSLATASTLWLWTHLVVLQDDCILPRQE